MALLKLETDLYDTDDLSARHREHRVLGGGELEERVVELAAGGRGRRRDAGGRSAARRRHCGPGPAVNLLVDWTEVLRRLKSDD